MVNDVFEKSGWITHFLGANTPSAELVEYAKKVNPEVIAVSTSIFFHIPKLDALISTIKNIFPNVPVLIGGQAFKHGGDTIINKYSGVTYVKNLVELKLYLKNL